MNYSNDFWIPSYKYQYVEWLNRHYSKDKNGRKINWDKFPLKRLKAIYIGIRKDEKSDAASKKSSKVRTEQKQDRPVHGNASGKDASSDTVVKNKESQSYLDFSTQGDTSSMAS